MRAVDEDPVGGRTAIIVSGAHHSGAPAISEVLTLLGAVRPGRAVEELDERLVARFASWSLGWDRIDADELHALVRPTEHARRAVRDSVGDADLVVLDDQRISRLLPLWTRALEQEGFRCVHVLALRHPAAVARAFRRRESLGGRAAALTWLTHTLDAELHSREHPRVVLSYEALLRDWRSEADRLARALGVRWPVPPDEAASDVAEVLGSRLGPSPAPAEPKGPVAALSPVHDVFRRWSEDDVRTGDDELLESWRAMLHPVRRGRSATARISLDRRELVADLQTRHRRVGPLGSARPWARIERQGHYLEAAAAWTWLMRERRHPEPSSESATGRIRRRLREDERARKLVGVVRGLGGRGGGPAGSARRGDR